MHIYVASSWRNVQQPEVVQALRAAGHTVYDFRAPPSAFGWHNIDPNWQEWSAEAFLQNLKHPYAVHGFNRDMDALRICDACVLVLPCGRSAHLELGFAVGTGKKTYILLDDPISEPELMYRMVPHVVKDLPELLRALDGAAAVWNAE